MTRHQHRILQINISSYWYSGTGKGSGHHLDSLVDKDASGLPFLPGRSLKGQLRDAVKRMESWKHYEAISPGSWTEILFGSSAFKTHQGKSIARDYTRAGCLRFSDAQLEPQIHDWLSLAENAEHRQELYQPIYSTAINPIHATAKEKSLRAKEVVIPLTLLAQIELREELLPAWGKAVEAQVSSDWEAVINQALPLIRAVGGGRNRGFGRAELSLGEKLQQSPSATIQQTEGSV